MIEIISLYFLTKYIGKLALQKGLKPLTWKINTIVAWLIGEMIGVLIAMNIFDLRNPDALKNGDLLKVSLVALPFAFGGFHYIKHTLEKKPDSTPTHFEQPVD